MKEWHDFFVACSGAAAALTGLIFVGVSISLAKILSYKTLPDRAIISLMLLLVILIVSLIQLVPFANESITYILTLFFGVVLWGSVTFLDGRIYKGTPREHKGSYLRHSILNQLSSLPYITGAIFGLFNSDCARFIMMPAIIISFIKASFDAWVLLIEINR